MVAASDAPSLQAQAAALHQTVFGDSAADVEAVKRKEEAIGGLADTYVKLGDAKALTELLSALRPFFALIPKAKTAKLVRNIIDAIAKIPDSTDIQVEVCKQQVEWAVAEKRTFLRQRIQLRLASLYLDTAEYQESLKIVATLLTEVKKLDDKLLLVDIHLLESRVHHALRNQPKSRASLTAARTAANAIYVPIALQAEIDTQSGILHADEKDYKTAYSYFFEAFEQFAALDDPQAMAVLKYMLLCKVMLNDAGDVPSIISSKAGLKYVGPDVDAMRAVAKAYQDRSLKEFQSVLDSYKPQLEGDAIVHTHLTALYGTLLEQNLVRLIEPYSRVEISHIAGLIELPVAAVEQKLSQMILDRKFSGTLDQGAGCLEVFDGPPRTAVYDDALSIMDTLSSVVDTLFARSQNVVASV
ncbi:RPN6 [Scenedesmus sp. PABB004]|nr:RPN6 [Scenedesmus sp. PABB004]